MKKKEMFLKAEAIYRYLDGNERLETLIMCKPADTTLMTTDQSLYEALGSIDKTKINYNKLVKFLENVDVLSFRSAMKKERKVLMEERVIEIREKGKNDHNKINNDEAIKNAGEKD